MVTFLSELNGMELWATDIRNAYYEECKAKKLFIVAGPEFGKLEGHMLIISKAPYRLRTSGLLWHKLFCNVFGKWVLSPVRHIWMR
jgi:hypothetical protein